MEMEPMDTTPSSRPGITRVPPEICGLIIASTSWKMDDLLSLGRVTSTFAEEADRIIYANVAIRRVGNIVRFCNTLNKRKYLASYVKFLRLFMPPQTQFDPNDVTLLARTLSQLKNLRVLRVAPDEPGAYKDAILRRLATPSKGEAVNGWILENHPFELEGFENTYFGADTLVHFVNQQPKLKTL